MAKSDRDDSYNNVFTDHYMSEDSYLYLHSEIDSRGYSGIPSA